MSKIIDLSEHTNHNDEVATTVVPESTTREQLIEEFKETYDPRVTGTPITLKFGDYVTVGVNLGTVEVGGTNYIIVGAYTPEVIEDYLDHKSSPTMDCILAEPSETEKVVKILNPEEIDPGIFDEVDLAYNELVKSPVTQELVNAAFTIALTEHVNQSPGKYDHLFNNNN